MQPEEVQMQNMSLYSGRDGGGAGGQGGNAAAQQQAMYAAHHGNHLVSDSRKHLIQFTLTQL